MLVVIHLVLFVKTYNANASIEDNKNRINDNINTIDKYEDIKDQLHILAELIRDTEEIDAEFLNSLGQEWYDYNNMQNALLSENNELENKIIEKEKSKRKFLGYFTITHYTIDSCGKSPSHPAYGITATGTYATPGRTIATDKKTIPMGSTVIIDGHSYIAEDTGGAIKGNKIDICVATIAEAYQKGVRHNVPVYIEVE